MNKKESEELKEIEIKKEEEKAQKLREISINWQQEQERLKLQSPEEKTERVIQCIVMMIYKIRNGFNREPNEERIELIRKRILEYFIKQENQDKAWVPKEIYQDLLPPKRVGEKRDDNWSKIGDLLGGIEKKELAKEEIMEESTTLEEKLESIQNLEKNSEDDIWTDDKSMI